MKLLIIHNNYQQTGGELAAVEAQKQLLHQHQVDYLFYGRDNREIDEYSLSKKVVFLLNTVFSWRSYREIQSVVAQERPDVAHIHNVFPLISPSVYRGLKKANIPIAQTLHNFRFLCVNGLFYTHGQICERCKYGKTFHAVQMKCFRESYVLSAIYALSLALHRRWGTFDLIDRYIALSQFTRTKFTESNLASEEKISVIPNFLMDPLPNPNLSQDRDRYFLFLGRINKQKGIETLIEVVANYPEFHLKVAGNDSEGWAASQNVKNIGQSNVEFLGQVQGNKKWDLLQKSYATILPSVGYENFPITLLESMATGAPVIASDIGSFPHIITDRQNGLLFRAGNALDLAEKMAWLANHPLEAQKMGIEGRRLIENEYSAKTHFVSLMNTYQEMIANTRATA